MTTPHLEYPLDKTTRLSLLQKFPPRYDVIKAEHVTISLHKPDVMPEAQRIDIVGYADNGSGMEAMLVEVDGTHMRADGHVYHVTWSFNDNKYRARDAATLVATFLKAGKIQYFDTPIALGPARAQWVGDETPGPRPSGPASSL